ncbi:hypothetical protein E4U21_006718 [Claviceps maximensis]|nr:hypothetical protein E4U21_006718 [Claviceps maximensis]
MAMSSETGLEILSDDEIVEIEFARSRPSPHGAMPGSPFHNRVGNSPRQNSGPATLSSIFLAQMDASLASRTTSRSQRRQETRPPPMVRPSQRSADVIHLPQPAAVIDLTEEPDSPLDQRQSQPPSQAGRNPRRTNSQRITPPSLSRSDRTMMGPEPSVIDLTADSPELERQSEPRTTRSRQYRDHNRHMLHQSTSGFAHEHIIGLEIANAPDGSSSLYTSSLASISQGFHRLAAGFFYPESASSLSSRAPNHFPPPAALAHREPTPKPTMEPLPPTREGFTRDTSSTEERLFVCPACNDELAYDSSGNPNSQPSNTGKVRKRKRVMGEHHFWALKKCGHVYCADCFENRRPTKACPEGVGFRAAPGKSLSAAPNEIRCAVDSCDTKVALKTEWVGIFL